MTIPYLTVGSDEKMRRAMGRPSWRDEGVGSRVRVAVWLLTNVGVGGVFTKAMLREAFPGLEQIDKRMRELRPRGWRIDTAREDRTLKLNELRFVKEGDPVWDTAIPPKQELSAKERKSVLERDGYACVTCGIAAGVPHPEAPLRRAHVAPAPISTLAQGPTGYVTECDMCRAAAEGRPDASDLVARAARLSSDERALLATLLSEGSRPRSAVEQLWADLRRAGPEQRERVIRAISNSDVGRGPGAK